MQLPKKGSVKRTCGYDPVTGEVDTGALPVKPRTYPHAVPETSSPLCVSDISNTNDLPDVKCQFPSTEPEGPNGHRSQPTITVDSVS